MNEPSKTIVIGAGPAGLAVAASLKQAGQSAVVLEQATNVGSAWRNHYDRLHLHTPKSVSALPYAPFPEHMPRYPSRAQLIEYLESYTERFDLQPRFGQHVNLVKPVAGGWEVQTQDVLYSAKHVVVATGNAREPNRPTWPGQEQFSGRILHSSDYRNAQPYAGQRVLVIGFGNSGGEIALDLVEHGVEVTMSVRGPVNVMPRDLFGIPILAIGVLQRRLPPRLVDAINRPILRARSGNLSRYGLQPQPFGVIEQIRSQHKIPLIDVGTIEMIKKGRIHVRPGIERFTPGGVRFSNGQAQDFDAVICATGYRPRVNTFLRGCETAFDAVGTPLTSGRETLPGLYFCGFFVSPNGMLREIAQEAGQIAASIVRSR